MIITVEADYVRHSDGAVCSRQVDLEVGEMQWKSIWASCLYPGHRMFKIQVMTVDGVEFIKWARETGWKPPVTVTVKKERNRK